MLTHEVHFDEYFGLFNACGALSKAKVAFAAGQSPAAARLEFHATPPLVVSSSLVRRAGAFGATREGPIESCV